MKLTDYPDKEGQIYGIFIAVALMAYFWIAWLFGFVNIPELRLFNLFIQTGGIYLACKQFKRNHAGNLHYFRAITIGFLASTIGTSLFAFFLFILFQINKGLYESIIKNEPLRPYLTVYLATFAVWTEGIISGSVATFFADKYHGYGSPVTFFERIVFLKNQAKGYYTLLVQKSEA